ncbi:hypothetical protein T05_849 [Trichinella murrelli]|uniref:Uncharacterized protein n=1 Tax=Trichinella murrelli TaxID=144512 RepID=A0A0V0T984_9BILA|nr:hypothetical protein T05_849 [Trichinella murrelli]
MNFRYKCYYDHEHCLEDISLGENAIKLRHAWYQ